MKRFEKFLALVIALMMILALLAGCNSSGGETEVTTEKSTESESLGDNTPEDVTDESTEGTTEKQTHANTEDNTEETTEAVIEGPHEQLITTADDLANSVQGGYTNGNWREFDMSNQNMSLRYVLSRDRDQQVAYIKNSQGVSYIENTMDVFVKMTDGYTTYASRSTTDSLVNIYNFGQYYYDFRMQWQNFANGLEIVNETEIALEYTQINGLSKPQINDGVMSFYVKSFSDPYIVFSRSLDIDGSLATHVQITMKVDCADSMSFFFIADDMSAFNSSAHSIFEVIPDGEFHTYTVPIGSYNKITGLRLDINNGKAKEEIFEISSVKLVKAEENGIPDIKLENVFHTYSDKLHHEIHIATYNEVTDVAEVGIKTEIAADTVSKLIVKDKNGTHESLNGVDWASVECVGFDVTDAGVIGFILPVDETTGTIKVTLEDGKYVIIYSRAPENNTLAATEGTPSSKPGTVAGNTNDFYMGQRIYTDESHSFDELLRQTEIERNPLGAKNIKVSTAYSANASFLGYDAIRGCYEFWVGYNKMSTEYPNRQFNLNFTIKSDDYERICYIVAGNDNGASPWGVLMDENLLQLPVNVQLWKNFTDGDETLFNVLDERYQEAIVPVISPVGEAKTYNLLSVYYNWGNFPVKQLSSIQYGAPYYHVVTGLVETNCMVPWRYTQTPDVPNRLPDHRPMSAPEWPGNIQHTQAGCHNFNDYVEVKEQIIHSYGPTYIDLEMIYSNDDYTVTYHHIEMPQTDENRTYYTIDYVFDRDTTFKDFKNSFSFYWVSSFESLVDFAQFGYVDENGESQLGRFDELPENTVFYKLGEKPYVSLFDLDHLNYCNVSFIISDYSVVLEGAKSDIDLLGRFNKGGSSVALTLDLGDVTFKAGDTVSLDIILMPWGSEQSDYSGNIYAPDQNVRDARENTVLNPIVITPESDCEVVESSYVPMAKTTNGHSATFTISGGKQNEHKIPYRDEGYNVAVRIDGFKELGVPVVQQLIDGEWVDYVLSSATNLDKGGHGAHYDGYGVHYNEDGTHSYSFVVSMDDATAKTFRISLLEDFEKFPWIIVDDATLVTETPFNVFKDANGFAGSLFKGWFSRVTTAEEGGVSYVSLYAHPTYNESQMERTFKNNEGITTGQYVFFKYRLPKDNKLQDVVVDFFASTVNERAVTGDGFAFDDEIICDGNWHVIVVDVSSFGKSTIIPEADGTYKLKHVRLDPINGINDTTHRIDFAFFAIHDDLDEILDFCKEAGDDEVIFATGRGSETISTSGGNAGDEEGTEEETTTEETAPTLETPFLFSATPDKLSGVVEKGWFSSVSKGEENDVSFMSFSAHSSKGESQIKNIVVNTDGRETGQYLILKYRSIVADELKSNVILQFFTSTVNEKAMAGDSFELVDQVISDGEWHVIVLDVSSYRKNSIAPDENGAYKLKHLRFDPVNGINDTNHRIDIAYIALHNDLDEILKFVGESGDTEILLVTRAESKTVSTKSE